MKVMRLSFSTREKAETLASIHEVSWDEVARRTKRRNSQGDGATKQKSCWAVYVPRKAEVTKDLRGWRKSREVKHMEGQEDLRVSFFTRKKVEALASKRCRKLSS